MEVAAWHLLQTDFPIFFHTFESKRIVIRWATTNAATVMRTPPWLKSILNWTRTHGPSALRCSLRPQGYIIDIMWFRSIRGVTLRSQEVHRSEKSEKKIPEKPDFPDPDPDFRIYVHGVAMGAERATCSQNFRPLAAIVPENARSLTIIIQ